jgi:hypothetical protein
MSNTHRKGAEDAKKKIFVCREMPTNKKDLLENQHLPILKNSFPSLRSLCLERVLVLRGRVRGGIQ